MSSTYLTVRLGKTWHLAQQDPIDLQSFLSPICMNRRFSFFLLHHIHTSAAFAKCGSDYLNLGSGLFLFTARWLEYEARRLCSGHVARVPIHRNLY